METIHLKKLLHERNLNILKNIVNLDLKYRRLLNPSLRDLESQEMNIMFPQFYGITVGELASTQVLLKITGANKKRFNEQLENLIHSKKFAKISQ
jgi:hypothetical protein